ncbi:MAG: hypothetical protein R3E32_08575 [Chitinophagales bacterium]
MWKTTTIIAIILMLTVGIVTIYILYQPNIQRHQLAIKNIEQHYDSILDSVYVIQQNEFMETKKQVIDEKQAALSKEYNDTLQLLKNQISLLEEKQILAPEAEIYKRKKQPKYKIVEKNITLKEFDKFYTESLTQTRFYVAAINLNYGDSTNVNFDCTIRITPPNLETTEYSWQAGNVYYQRAGYSDRYFEIFVNSVKDGVVKLLLRIY